MTAQPNTPQAPLSVSELIVRMQSRLRPLNPILVQGEISGLVRSQLGHRYFDLKEGNSKISCVIFRGAVTKLQDLRNGLMVRVGARVDIYAPRGSLQLKVDRIEPQGEGDLWLRYERLKAKLTEEGLFASERKRPLPRYPERIVLISSASGAAYHDVCKTLQLTWPWLRVSFVPSSVQGASASAEIVRALESCRSRRIADSHDLILLVRGGGSLDDLWCFNEEAVVRACADAALPVVTGIGHETDYTLCDFVADHRGATPTAAAAAISPGREWLGKHLAELLADGHGAVEARRRALRERWSQATARLAGLCPIGQIESLRQGLDLSQSQAGRAALALHSRLYGRFAGLRGLVLGLHPTLRAQRQREALGDLARRAHRCVLGRLDAAREALGALKGPLANAYPRHSLRLAEARLAPTTAELGRLHPLAMHERLSSRLADLRGRLEEAHPDRILAKGYARLSDSAGKLVRTRAQALAEDELSVHLQDGRFRARPLPEPPDAESEG